MIESDPPMDAQSRAFRLAGPDDWASDEQLDAVSVPFDPSQASPRSEWERGDWDSGRQSPKTVDEAVAEAERRGDDPTPYLNPED